MFAGAFGMAVPFHGTHPKSNAEWWREKPESNIVRDLDTNRRLNEAGWSLVVVWEHDDLQAAAEHLDILIRELREDENHRSIA